MNIKKVFASLTGVLMLATTVTPLVTGAASYGAELEGAYKYAFEKGITTMTSIDSANMYGEITRGQLAKMISNWAEAELGQKADATKVCSFTDEGTAEGDLAMYLKKSCQMGLMGQGIAEFRPNAKVTRGEFGTTLSRALWGDKYNTTANPYYVNHLQALKDAGIMTRIETPNQLEIRGYVMLMLQRAVAKKDAANCADPVIALACSLGQDTCPAACKKTETVDNTVVKAGDLKVTAAAASNRRIIAGAVSDLDTLTFAASENVTLSRVVLERYGYSNNEVLSGVWLENAEGVRVSSIRTPNNRDEMSLAIERDYRNMGTKASFTIVAEVKSGAVNQTIGFKVKSVESTAKNLDISSYTPFNYDVVDYKGGDVQVSLKGSDRIYQFVAGRYFEVARMQVKATNKTVLVNGFTLTNTGTLDLSRYLDNVNVTVDGKALSNVKVSADRNGKLVLSFDNVRIENKKNATFVVAVSFKNLDKYQETVNLTLASKSDIKATEDKTGARVSAHADTVAGKTYTFAGGQTRLTNTKLASIIDAAQGSQNVVFAEGELNLTEAVELQNVVLTTDVAANNTGLESISIIVAGEEYSAQRDQNDKNKFSFGRVLLEKSGKIQFKANLESEATKDSLITVKMGGDQLFSQTDFSGAKYYDANNQTLTGTDVIGSISLAKIKVQVARATMVNNLTKEVEVMTGDTANRVVFDGTYTAQKQDVTLRHLTISELNNKQLANGEQVEFTVAINGTTVDTVTFASGDSQKASFPAEVLVKKGEKATVKVTANVLLLSEKNLTYKVELKGEDLDGADSGIGSANTVKINAKGTASVSVSSVANTQNTLLLRSSNIDLATYTVRPYNGVEGSTVSAVEVSIDGASIATMDPEFDQNSLILYVNGQEVTDVTVAANGNKRTLKADNLNETLPVGGFEIKVSSRVELPVGSYKITLDKVNDKGFNREINKTITDALIRVTSQTNRGSNTQYILDVKGVNGDEVVTELKFMKGDKVLAEKDVVSLGEDSLTIVNGVDPIAIDTITYKVNGKDVKLKSSDLSDYFLVNGRGLQVFAITNN